MSNKLAIEILNEYPLATEAVRDWFMKKMLNSLENDGVPEDFKKQLMSMGVKDATLAIMLDDSPRNFFDVLDDNRIVIEILRNDSDDNLFYYAINGVADLTNYIGRIPCERAAVIKAFEKLN